MSTAPTSPDIGNPARATVLLVSPDLMVQSPLRAETARQGCELCVAANLAAIEPMLSDGRPRLVVLDLTTPGVDPAQLAEMASRLPCRPTLIAFGPHVHTGRLEAARDAQFWGVFARGEFHGRMGEILARALAEPWE